MTAEAARELHRWLDERGVRGIEWEEADIEPDHRGKVRPGVAAAARLRSSLPYDDPYPLVTLLGRVLRRFVWIDAARIVLAPVAPARRFVISVDLHLYDPAECFESPRVLSKLQGTGEMVEKAEAIGRLLREAVDHHAGSLAPDDARTFLAGVDAYRSSGLSSDRDRAVAAFKPLLPVDLFPVMRDWRLLEHLYREHAGTLEAVEKWMFQGRTSMEGRMQGVIIRPFPWVALEQGYEHSTIPEVGGEPGVGRPDPEALLAILADETRPGGRQLEAFLALRSLPGEEATPYLIRSAGYDGRRLDALRELVRIPCMIPLVREVILTDEIGRIIPTLDRLRTYGIEFRDPMEAWQWAAGEPRRDERLGVLYQQAILRDYSLTGDRSIIPVVIREIEAGSASDAWILAAVGMLRSFEAAEAAEVILGLTESPWALLRRDALEFFAIVDHPPAVPVLEAALHEEDLWIVSGAERGLAGQRSLDTEALLAALVLLDRRARRIPLDGDDEHFRKQLGGALVQAVIGREEDSRPRIVDRVLKRTRTPWSRPPRGIWAFPSVEDGSAVGPNPLETFRLRMEVWRSQGFVTDQYRLRGHKDPRWDDPVEEAHERYDPDAARQDPDLIHLYEQALRAGCHDGMVHYRLAVCHHLRGDLESALPHYEKACDLVPDRYPESPYRLAAAEVVAEARSKEGRYREARDLLQAALKGEMESEKSRELLDRLETIERLRLVDVESQPVLDVGDLSRLPARYHRAAVTSVRIGPDGRYLLSADAAGWVHLYAILGEQELFGEVCLRAGAAGPTHASWVDPDGRVFVTGGPDGRILRCRFEDDLESRIQADLLLEHDSAVTAIAGTTDGRFVFADERGRLVGCDLEGGCGRVIPRRGKEVIRTLQRRHSMLAALAGASELEVWSLEADPSPTYHEDLSRFGRVALVDIGAPESVLAIIRGCDALNLDLATGDCEVVPQLGSVPGEVRFARTSRIDGIVVWANEAGCIRVEGGSGEGSWMIVCDTPLEAFDVSFERRIIAHADSTHGIGMHRMDDRQMPTGGTWRS